MALRRHKLLIVGIMASIILYGVFMAAKDSFQSEWARVLIASLAGASMGVMFILIQKRKQR